MGSFYTTCSISNLTITEGQKMVSILLVPETLFNQRYTEAHFEWRSNRYRNIDSVEPVISDFDDPNADPKDRTYDSSKLGFEKGLQLDNYFFPFGFPIRGKYYDYGYMRDICRDENVEMLEEYFGISIEDILSFVESSRPNECNPKNIDLLNRMYVTHIKEEVYDFLSNIKPFSYSSYDDEDDEDAWGEEDKIYQYESFGLDLDAAGNFFEEYIISKEKLASLEMEYSKIMKLPKEEISGEYLTGLMLNKYKLESKLEMTARYLPQLLHDNFMKDCNVKISQKQDWLKLLTFLKAIDHLHIRLQPSMYGSQYTNWQLVKGLNDFVSNLINKISE